MRIAVKVQCQLLYDLRSAGGPLFISVQITTPNIDFGSLLRLFEQSEPIRKIVVHNVAILKCVRGGLKMAERYRIDFDPRREYWWLPERRFCVAYLAERWTGRFMPPATLRRLALALLSHFDRARAAGVISYTGVHYDEAGGFEAVCSVLADHALRMNPIPEWDQLRRVWSDLPADLAADVAGFLRDAPNDDRWERPFRQRLPWFG